MVFSSTSVSCTVGSDVCEVFFRKVGGLIQNERKYEGCDLVGRVGASARIVEYEVDPKDPSFNKAHKKQTHVWYNVELDGNSLL